MQAIKAPPKVPIIIIFVFLSALVYAQSSQVIDEILLEEKATFGKTVYLVLTAAGLIPEEASIQDAVDSLADKEWRVRAQSADAVVGLGALSYLIMKSFDIPGGLFYTIFPGPRYASRELKYLGFFTGRYATGRTVSGEDVLRILGNALAWKEVE